MPPGQMMNTPLSITAIMRFAERVYPDTEIVSQLSPTETHRYTYADAFRRARQLANALRSAGVKPGDRVGTLAWNDYRHFEVYYAVSCSGAVCHTINPRLFPEQIEYIINHAEDTLLFVDPAFLPLLENIKDKIGNIRQIIVLADEVSLETSWPVQPYETFIADQPGIFDWPELDEHTASSLCYTSGTTGNPKGVLYSHRSMVLHSYALALPDALNLSAREVAMPVVPMFHVNAWGLPYACPMVGAKLVFPGPCMGNGEVLTRLINEEGVTVSAGVPTVWLALLDYLDRHQQTVPGLDRLIVGGAACPPALLEAFEERYQVTVIPAWGMTELSPVGTVNSPKPGMGNLPKAQRDKYRLSAGRPVFGVEFKIVDDADNEQPWDGESVGEVKVKGPWVCASYYKHPHSDAHDQDGWFATGDVASFDRDGYMHITDRTKDLIKSGGEWISSIELENAAMGHPAVKEAAVIGIPHPKWTERPLLVVVKETETRLDQEGLLCWLEGRVAKWWLPEEVVFVEALPHTATGKVSKKDLREQFAQRAAASPALDGAH